MIYIFRNLRSFAKQSTFFFALTVFCVLASSFIMLFAFGVYQNYKIQKEEYTYQQLRIGFDFSQYNADTNQFAYTGVTQGELRAVVESFSPQIMNNSYCCVGYEASGINTETVLCARFHYRNGRYQPMTGNEQNLRSTGQVIDGRFYTEEEYASGEKVILATPDMLNEDGKVIFGGESFTPIMLVEPGSDVPFPSVPDEETIGFITFCFDRPPTSTTLSALLDTFRDAFGERVYLPDVEPTSQENYYLYNTIILIAVMIAVVAAINIVILYYYVLLKRIKSLAVCMLCGCTRGKAVSLYLGESLMLTVPLFSVSALFFDKAAMPLLTKLFPYIATAYSLQLYILALGIYVGICTIGMCILSISIVWRNSIVAVKAGGV